jgi:pimeloyl-ACP methyl ester carboxylesterase
VSPDLRAASLRSHRGEYEHADLRGSRFNDVDLRESDLRGVSVISTSRPTGVTSSRATCPVLLVAGEDSQFWPASHATDMAARNEEVEAVVLEGCGYPVNIDDPEAFNATLLRLLTP